MTDTTLNGYIARYQSETLEVRASTRLEASKKALAHFQEKYPRRKLKSYEVTSTLAERAGVEVIHQPDF
jgi:hypothetical protein